MTFIHHEAHDAHIQDQTGNKELALTWCSAEGQPVDHVKNYYFEKWLEGVWAR